jgi:hypothetical protein
MAAMLLLLAAPGWSAPLAAPLDEHAKLCIRQLQAIGRALAAYQRDRGELPPHLSDLYPRYLADLTLLLCPADQQFGATGLSGVDPDPLPISYFYEMSLAGRPGGLLLGPAPAGRRVTWRQWKMAQRVQYGDRVPVVSCWHHLRQGYRLNLTLTGHVYRSEIYWGWYCFALAGRAPAATRRHLCELAGRLTALGQTDSGMADGGMANVVGSMWYAGGDTQRAIAAYQSAMRQPGTHQETAGLLLANLFQDLGQAGSADMVVRHMPAPPRAGIRWMNYLAGVFESAGLTDRAAAWRRRAAAWGRGADRLDQQAFLIPALVLLAALVFTLLRVGGTRSRRVSLPAAPAGGAILPRLSDLPAFDLGRPTDSPPEPRPALAGLTPVSLASPRPISAAARRVRTTARVIYFLGGFGILAGLSSALSPDSAVRAPGVGFVSAIIGIWLLPLAFHVQRRSTTALWITVTLFAVGAAVSFAAGVQQEGRPLVGTLVATLLVLRLLWQGFGAIRELMEEENGVRR